MIGAWAPITSCCIMLLTAACYMLPPAQSWVETRGLRAAVVPELPPGSTPPPGCAVVKSIVCMADGKPVVAVVLLEGRLEERKLADLLKVGHVARGTWHARRAHGTWGR